MIIHPPERQSYGAREDRECFVCWCAPQMAAAARAGTGQNRDLELSPVLPGRSKDPRMWASSTAFPGKVELAPLWMLVLQAAVYGHYTMLAVLFCFKYVLCFCHAVDLYEP